MSNDHKEVEEFGAEPEVKKSKSQSKREAALTVAEILLDAKEPEPIQPILMEHQTVEVAEVPKPLADSIVCASIGASVGAATVASEEIDEHDFLRRCEFFSKVLDEELARLDHPHGTRLPTFFKSAKGEIVALVAFLRKEIYDKK